ncbi:nitrous oxide reductase accessory protein NosL [Aneurinibacillus terranovensis]|uniref:nitrous oxide reductase accessory protein NosL n=1 Tax=Aneurinibacillus terranovensis TaxID=278991 RepID=UPI000415C896|nr:nitrous oxide reductase accessory protein NosL [Aneurinibacillus terranovensis]
MYQKNKWKWTSVVFFCVLLCVLLLPACAQKESAQPQPIDEAVDTCTKCHMAIKNNGYAAQYITEDGKNVKFDDLGCMQTYIKDHPNVKVAAEFVEDSQSKEWIQLKDASYVFAMDVPTPMGYGMHAFKEKAAAESFSKTKGIGQVMTYNDIRQHEWKMDKSKMMKHEGMMQGGMMQMNGSPMQGHGNNGQMKGEHKQ